MSLPQIVTREEWTAARIELLEREKELTRARDALSAARRRLPMVEVTKPYRFTGPDGELGLADLFAGRSQLIVAHFMFHPEWDEGCSGCAADADEVGEGLLAHLHAHDTTLVFVARAPIEKIERYKDRRGWTMPFVSSYGSDFNEDFGVTLVPRDGQVTYNYRAMPASPDGPGEAPGKSCFLRVGERVFHTYSTYARGLEATGGAYYFLDLTALGRQEEWEEPRGRARAPHRNVPDFAVA
jgi:predicted dithiol-disulfide oxidoreductase (DUF899 family)